MKRLLIGVLLAITLFCGALGLAACNDGTTGDKWGDVYTIQAAYEKASELGYTGTLEDFIAEISGKDGSNGKDGKDGIDGVGIEKIEINAQGELIITFTDETTKNLGNITKCNHSYTSWEEIVAADCTSIGYSTRTCSKCGDIDYKFTEKKGHVWDDGIVIKKSTSTEKGLKLHSCTVCRTAKTEETDLVKVMTAAEWKKAVHDTIMIDNFSYDCYYHKSSAKKPVYHEKVLINVDKGLSYFYSNAIPEYEGKTEERELYYQLNKTDEVYFERYTYEYEEEPSWNKTQDWYGVARISHYATDDYKDTPEKVKYELTNSGYSFLESLKNIFTYEDMWSFGVILEDAYEYFEYDAEKDVYSYSEDDGDNTYVYSFKFENGYISAIYQYAYQEDTTDFVEIEFYDYGTTNIVIPQAVTTAVSQKGLSYEVGKIVQGELEIKSAYFGITVTSIGDMSFDGEREELQKITIPASVTHIDEDAFNNCYNLSEIHFGGTKAQWNAIDKGENWDKDIGSYTVYCKDENIVVSK